MTVRLPSCDVRRAELLGDPMMYVVKTILLHKKNQEPQEFNHETKFDYQLRAESELFLAHQKWIQIRTKIPCLKHDLVTVSDSVVHLLCCLFVRPQDNVVQFGSLDNGCTTCVLSHLVTDSFRQLVLFETNPKEVARIRDNIYNHESCHENGIAKNIGSRKSFFVSR